MSKCVLHCWGEITDYVPIQEYQWFESRGAAMEAEWSVRQMAKAIGRIVAANIEENDHVDYRTVATMVLVYDGKEYPYEYDFGYGYPPDAAEFMFFEGNYSCDCNKLLFLRRRYPDQFADVDDNPCGDEIKIKDFKIEMR